MTVMVIHLKVRHVLLYEMTGSSLARLDPAMAMAMA